MILTRPRVWKTNGVVLMHVTKKSLPDLQLILLQQFRLVMDHWLYGVLRTIAPAHFEFYE